MGRSALRQKILKRAAQLALGTGEGAGGVITDQASNKALAGSIAQQEKQLGAMTSFVNNLEQQVDKVSSLAKDLQTFDTRILNVPLRMVRGRLSGSPLQAKYDMYLAEIESEIGKLATSSTASVAELSQGAQEKWAKIHDKNLSVGDMIELLKETKNAGRMRLSSVETSIKESKDRMKTLGKKKHEQGTAPQSAIDHLKKNPQLKDAFKAKYGYIPEGI